MKLKYQICPQQPDDISCGVFVCIHMYYFAIKKENELPKHISKDKLKTIRNNCIYKILKEQVINYQDVNNMVNVI